MGKKVFSIRLEDEIHNTIIKYNLYEEINKLITNHIKTISEEYHIKKLQEHLNKIDYHKNMLAKIKENNQQAEEEITKRNQKIYDIYHNSLYKGKPTRIQLDYMEEVFHLSREEIKRIVEEMSG